MQYVNIAGLKRALATTAMASVASWSTSDRNSAAVQKTAAHPVLVQFVSTSEEACRRAAATYPELARFMSCWQYIGYTSPPSPTAMSQI